MYFFPSAACISCSIFICFTVLILKWFILISCSLTSSDWRPAVLAGRRPTARCFGSGSFSAASAQPPHSALLLLALPTKLSVCRLGFRDLSIFSAAPGNLVLCESQDFAIERSLTPSCILIHISAHLHLPHFLWGLLSLLPNHKNRKFSTLSWAGITPWPTFVVNQLQVSLSKAEQILSSQTVNGA